MKHSSEKFQVSLRDTPSMTTRLPGVGNTGLFSVTLRDRYQTRGLSPHELDGLDGRRLGWANPAIANQLAPLNSLEIPEDAGTSGC